MKIRWNYHLRNCKWSDCRFSDVVQINVYFEIWLFNEPLTGKQKWLRKNKYVEMYFKNLKISPNNLNIFPDYLKSFIMLLKVPKISPQKNIHTFSAIIVNDYIIIYVYKKKSFVLIPKTSITTDVSNSHSYGQ